MRLRLFAAAAIVTILTAQACSTSAAELSSPEIVTAPGHSRRHRRDRSPPLARPRSGDDGSGRVRRSRTIQARADSICLVRNRAKCCAIDPSTYQSRSSSRKQICDRRDRRRRPSRRQPVDDAAYQAEASADLSGQTADPGHRSETAEVPQLAAQQKQSADAAGHRKPGRRSNRAKVHAREDGDHGADRCASSSARNVDVGADRGREPAGADAFS